MNYPRTYKLARLERALEKSPDLSLSMSAAAKLVGTFPGTITRLRQSKKVAATPRPFSRLPEVLGASVLTYFRNLNAAVLHARAARRKKVPKKSMNLLARAVAKKKT